MNQGHLHALVSDLAEIPGYWAQFCKDHPEHPVSKDADLQRLSLGCTLYCHLLRISWEHKRDLWPVFF